MPYGEDKQPDEGSRGSRLRIPPVVASSSKEVKRVTGTAAGPAHKKRRTAAPNGSSVQPRNGLATGARGSSGLQSGMGSSSASAFALENSNAPSQPVPTPARPARRPPSGPAAMRGVATMPSGPVAGPSRLPAFTATQVPQAPRFMLADERKPADSVLDFRGLPYNDRKGYVERLLGSVSIVPDRLFVSNTHDLVVRAIFNDPEKAEKFATQLHLKCFEGRQPTVKGRMRPTGSNVPGKKSNGKARLTSSPRVPLGNVTARTRTPSPVLGRGEPQPISRSPAREVDVRTHELSRACRSHMSGHQQTQEREVRQALLDASKAGFEVEDHYIKDLVLFMEGHQRPPDPIEIADEPLVAPVQAAEPAEEDEDGSPFYSPPPATLFEAPAIEPPDTQPIDVESAIKDELEEPEVVEVEQPPRKHADVAFPYGVYATISSDEKLLKDVFDFLQSFLQLFDESRGSLLDYYMPKATFSYAIHGKLDNFPPHLANDGRDVRNVSHNLFIVQGPHEILDVLRKLPPCQHDFKSSFAYDHWPLYDTKNSPIHVTVHGQYEEFLTSEIRSFSRCLLLVPTATHPTAGIKFVVQSDQLVIRQRGDLYPALRVREPDDPLPPVPVPSMPPETIELSDDEPATPMNVDKTPRKRDKAPRRGFVEMEVPQRRMRVPSIPATAPMPVEHLQAEVIEIHDSDFEEQEPDEADVAAMKEADAALEGPAEPIEEEEAISSESEAGKPADVTPAPTAHFYDSAIGFYTAQDFMNPRRHKMRAFFDTGKGYLAVSKSGEVLKWSKKGDRKKVGLMLAPQHRLDIQCVARSAEHDMIFMGLQTSKETDASQLSCLHRPQIRDAGPRLVHVSEKHHKDGGVSALCTVPIPHERVFLATGGWDHAIFLHQIEVDRPMHSLDMEQLPSKHSSAVQSIDWSSSRDALLSGGQDGKVFGYDLSVMKRKDAIKLRVPARIHQLQVNPAQSDFVMLTMTGTNEDQLGLYDLRNCSLVSRFGFVSPDMLNLSSFARGAWSPGGTLFALPGENKVRLWDLRNTSRIVQLLQAPSPGSCHVHFESEREVAVLESASFAYHKIALV